MNGWQADLRIHVQKAHPERSFGGAQVSRTFYAKGQTGQQLLLGAYSSLNRQINLESPSF